MPLLDSHNIAFCRTAAHLPCPEALGLKGVFGCRLKVCNEPSANLPLDIDVQALMERFLTLQHVFSLDDFLSEWFLGAPRDGILRNNVEEFMAYAFFYKPFAGLCTKVGKRILSLAMWPSSVRLPFATVYLFKMLI